MNQTWTALWKEPIPTIQTEGLVGDQATMQNATLTAGCMRPDVYLDNERTCDCCPIYPYCKSYLRFHSKDDKKLRRTFSTERASTATATASATTSETESSESATTMPSEPVQSSSSSSSSFVDPAMPVKRKQGRPKGSKNKPKVKP